MVLILSLKILHGQEDSTDLNRTKTHIIKINPLSWIVDRYTIYYEVPITNKWAFHGGGIYLHKVNEVDSSGNLFQDKYTGPGMFLEFKRYLLKSQSAPEGLYVGTNLRFQYIIWTSTFDDGNSPSVEEIRYSGTLGTGAIIGYQWIFWDMFTFDVLAGVRLSYQTNNTTTAGGTGGEDFSGIYPRAGLVFGMAF